jgi:hypothetical protein
MCGCGQKTALAKQSDSSNGDIKGKPVRFIPGHYRDSRTYEERFWEKVDKRGPDGCWLWTANHNSKGYGKIASLDGKSRMEYAHRISYQMHYGAFDPSLSVCHTCDNPSCVNPAHLFLGTAKDNAEDMIAKGRSPKGSRAGQSKLTEADVEKIWELLELGIQLKVIGAMFGVRGTSIGDIRDGVTWTHVKCDAKDRCHADSRFKVAA